jgi:uncharacterized protein with WD repeat
MPMDIMPVLVVFCAVQTEFGENKHEFGENKLELARTSMNWREQA